MGYRIDTVATHAGHLGRDAGASVTPALTLSTTFHQEGPGQYETHAYGRVGNPNRDALEATLAELEGGTDAIALASGCAAMHATLQLLSPGDHLVACGDIYGGTYRLIEQLVSPIGVQVSWVDMADVEAVRRAMRPTTRMVWIETPTNPLLRVFDIEAIAEVARGGGALSVVDNTFATPVLQRPLSLGADIVVHSMSKYLNGHSDVVAGAVVSNSKSAADRLRFMQRAGGAIPSPFDCYLVARGIKTLPLRMARHCDNAQALAEWLRGHDSVEAVYYPGLLDHAQHALAARQMSGFGGVVSFVAAGGLPGASDVLRKVELFSLAESLGGVESLIGQPALMSHASMPPEVRSARGIEDGLIRLSVGLEDVDDLREDLARAL